MARCIKTPGMPWSLAMFENTFCNKAVAICCKNVLYLREKNFHTSLKVIKNIAYEYLQKLCALMPFFFGIMYSEPNYANSIGMVIIPEALYNYMN